MELSKEAKRDILNLVLGVTADIADKEYQKRVWIRAEGPEWDDFDETCCHFFQEGDGVLEKYKAFGITENQYYILKNFRDVFRAFSNENDLPQEFIDTPEWTRITEMATEVLKAFNYQKSR